MFPSPGCNSLLYHHCKQLGNHRTHCDTSVIAHIIFISRLISRIDKTRGQTLREMVGKYAIEEPEQAFFQKITAIFDLVC